MNDDYRNGFRDGYETAIGGRAPVTNQFFDDIIQQKGPQRKAPRSRKQTPKQKLLTKMTAIKWNKYKKGSGKKTYVDIRAEVSRSQLYKRKAKRL
jgi:hypothetical protein